MRTMCKVVFCAAIVLAARAGGAVQLNTGDLLSAVRITGAPSGRLSVLSVDPTTGDREVISGWDGSTVIGSGEEIRDSSNSIVRIIYSRTGDIWVSSSQAWYHVNPADGDRTLVSGCLTSCPTPEVGNGPIPVGLFGLTEARPVPPAVGA